MTHQVTTFDFEPITGTSNSTRKCLYICPKSKADVKAVTGAQLGLKVLHSEKVVETLRGSLEWLKRTAAPNSKDAVIQKQVMIR
jgi:hypothetical protein